MRFYVLKCPRKVEESSAVTDFLKEEPINRGEAPRCEACGKYIGMLTWLPPYRVELQIWYKEYGDIAFGPGDDILVSERFKILYKESGLIGLEGFDPVEVVRVKRFGKAKGYKAKPPTYYRVNAVRSKTAIDVARSIEMPEKKGELCPVCLQPDKRGVKWRIQRVLIVPSTWSGEDIFIPRGLSVYVTTERFKAFCEENRITNAVLIPAEEYKESFGRSWADAKDPMHSING